MDHLDELDEPVISFSGHKRKIKAETFSRNLAKAARYNGEGKALCIVCNHIHTVYDHNNVCQISTLLVIGFCKLTLHMSICILLYLF